MSEFKLICPVCFANTFEQIIVNNDGMSPPSAECKICHTKWGGKQNIMVKGELPGQKDLPLKENKDMSPRTV